MRYPVENNNGIEQGMSIYDHLLKSLLMPSQIKMDKQLQKADLAQKLADIQAKQITNQYFPDQLSLGNESIRLGNQNQSIHNQYAEQIIKAALGLQDAQTNKMNGASSPTGELFQDYQGVISKYGANSPQAQQFKKMMDTQSQSQGIRNNYYQALTNSMPNRMLPQFNREQAVNQLLSQGYTVDQAAQMLSGMGPQGGMQPNNSGLANQQNEESQSRLMHLFLPASAQNAAYSAVTARPFGEAIMRDLPEASQYFGPKAAIKLTGDQLKSLQSGETPKGLEALGRFNQNLELYKEKVADILNIPASDMARSGYGKAFDFKTWYTNPGYAQMLLGDLVQRVNQAERGNLQGLSQVKQQLSVPIGGEGSYAIDPDQLNIAAQNSPEIAKSAGISSGIPQFNSKKEFQDWYAKQSPETQAMVRKVMGAK